MRLKSFLGCFSLQTGTAVIGTMSLVWAILSATCAFPLMDELRVNTQERLDPLLNFSTKSLITGLMIYIVVIGSMAGLMIYGAQKKNPDCVFPWLALSTTDFLVWSSMSWGGIVTAPMMFPITGFLIFLAISSVCVGIHFYIWLVVYSFYKQIVVEKYRIDISITDIEKSDQLKIGYHDV